MNKSTTILLLLVAGSVLNANANQVFAESGDPVAIRSWPDEGITIETMWNLHVGIGLTDVSKNLLSRAPDANLEELEIRTVATLRRSDNESQPEILYRRNTVQPNDVKCYRSGSLRKDDDKDRSGWGSSVKVDGMKIVFFNKEEAKVVNELLQRLGTKPEPDRSPVDVVVAIKMTHDESAILALASREKPRIMIVDPALTKIGDQDVIAIPHNTLVVSAITDEEKKGTRFVSLTDQPYKMSDELAELFSKKEVASKKSRDLFANLSIEQMNFRPSDGTHRPRWNAEHMMGRELLFFSQIYHAIDPNVPVMDLNPRQMPGDYEMAHPDWTGKEEARQMERVEAFTRRFAYLLDGMELDQKAQGSKFWTPRALLQQMERHYNEHTANVRKKMTLDDWPTE